MRSERVLFFYLLSLWVLAVLLSCIIFDPLSGTQTSPFHARMVELFRKYGFVTYDGLSYGGRAFAYYPFGYFLAGIATRIIPAEVFFSLFPALSFSAYILLVYLIHKKFSDSYSAMATVLLITTFAYGSFARFFIHQLAFVLALLSFYLILEKRYLAAGIVSGLTFLTHAESFLFLTIITAAFSIREKRGFIAILIGAALAIPYYLHLLSKFNWYLPILDSEYRWMVSSYWADVRPGLENILKLKYFIFLGIAGAIVHRREKIFPLIVFIGTFYVFMGSRFINPLGIIFFSIPSAAFLSDIKMKKEFYIATAVYSFLYLGYAVSGPLQVSTDDELLQTLKWVENNTPENTTVIASLREGHFITYYAKRKNFADGLFEFADLRRAKLSMLAFNGDTAAMKEILEMTEEPRVILIRKDSKIYDFVAERFKAAHVEGKYVVFE